MAVGAHRQSGLSLLVGEKVLVQLLGPYLGSLWGTDSVNCAGLHAISSGSLKEREATLSSTSVTVWKGAIVPVKCSIMSK